MWLFGLPGCRINCVIARGGKEKKGGKDKWCFSRKVTRYMVFLQKMAMMVFWQKWNESNNGGFAK